MDTQKADQAIGALAQWYRENRRAMSYDELMVIERRYFTTQADIDAFGSYLDSREGQAKFKARLKSEYITPKYSSAEIWTAFKNLCYSRGYTLKVVGDFSFEEPLKRGKMGDSCKLWGSKNAGSQMDVYDTRVKRRELIDVRDWINKTQRATEKPSTLVEPETCETLSPKYYGLLAWFGIPVPDYSFSIEPEAGETKLDAVMKRLKDGVDSIQRSDNYRQYLLTMSKFHDYSISNLMLIMLQKPNATRVAGFYTWKDLGRYVKAGEHGITVLAPCLPAKELSCPLCGAVSTEQQLRIHLQEAHGRSDYALIKQARESGSVPSPYGFKPVTIFDISQTQGKALPEVEVPTLTGAANEDLFDRMLVVAKSQGVSVSFESRPEQDPEIKGMYIVKSIWVRLEESRAQQLKTLIHEMAHYYTEGVFGVPRSDAETTAESSAFVVAAHFGFDTGTRSFPYVAVWSKESKVLERNLATIRKVSKALIDAAEKV